MKTLSDIKREIFEIVIQDPSSESKYGRFLDKLVLDEDRRGIDPDWDLWYFSDNTEFCMESAKCFMNAINKQISDHGRFVKDLDRKQPAETSFEFKKLRRLMGCFFFYLCSALESFAHEINIFYDLKKNRKDVTLFKIQKIVLSQRADCALCGHMKAMKSQPVHRILRTYRNAFAHGYVFPITADNGSIYISDHPQDPQFSFASSTKDLATVAELAKQYMNKYIYNGWRCFEQDELTDPSF